MRRITAGVLGFIVAPLISAVTLATATRLFEPSDIVARIAMVPVFYYFSAMATVLLGLPAFFVLLRFKIIYWWSVLAGGLVIGALMGAIVGAPNHAQLPNVLFMSATGAASAVGFWLIWRRGSNVTGERL